MTRSGVQFPLAPLLGSESLGLIVLSSTPRLPRRYLLLMEVPSVRARSLLYALLGLVVWSAALWTFWISEPLMDQVDVVALEQVQSEVDGQATTEELVVVRSVTATCGAPWESTAGPVSPLPALPAGESLAHVPCETLHRDNRLVLGLNAIVVLGGLVAMAVLMPHRVREASSDEELVLVETSSAS
jgi:hypothetical protein